MIEKQLPIINPLVSIIIPTFNRAHLISETLDSVLAQTYENWECIIVDDGSTDNSSKVIEHYLNKDARFQYHQRPIDRPKGANACRNYGFGWSRGEYIMFLDSDDILYAFCILERVELMVKKLNINLLVRDTSKKIDNIIINQSINQDPEGLISEEYLKMFLRYQIPWPIMGAFYKREILNSVQFDEELDRFQDVSLNIKVLSQINSLCILRDYKIDCYYRVDNNKLQREEHIEQVLQSLVKFNKIHSKLIVNKEYRGNLQLFNYRFFTKYLIFFFNAHKRVSNLVLFNSFNSKLFTFRQKISLIGLCVYLNTGLYLKKGYGANRFRIFFNNSFLD